MRRSLSAISWILVTAACSAPPPAPAPVVELPQAPPPTVAAPPTSPAAPPDPHAPPEVLAELTQERREELAELGALCPTAIFTSVTSSALLRSVGCTCCPSQCGPTPDRRPMMARPGAMQLSAEARLRGAFTEPGADERLVVLGRCTDNAHVLRADAAGRLAVRARAALRAGTGCRLVRRPGQVDRVLCSDLYLSGYSATTLSLYDFTGPPAKPGAELAPSFSFTALNDLGMRCWPGMAFAQHILLDWNLAEQDLTAKLLVRDGVMTQAAADRECGEGAPLPKAREVELRWTATPTGFAPTAKTAAEVKRLDAARRRAEP